jgi:hypothetical protein
MLAECKKNIGNNKGIRSNIYLKVRKFGTEEAESS